MAIHLGHIGDPLIDGVLLSEQLAKRGYKVSALPEDDRLARELLTSGISLDGIVVASDTVSYDLLRVIHHVPIFTLGTGVPCPEDWSGEVASLDALPVRAAAPLKEGWYFAIEKAFQLKGRGLVVTGTIAAGTVRVNDSAVLEPGRKSVRIGGITIGGKPVQEGHRGERASFNLVGAALSDTRPGQSLAATGTLAVTHVLEADLLIPNGFQTTHRYRIFIGADEAQAKLEYDKANPDLVRIKLESPVAATVGQPLLVQDDREKTWVAGGTVSKMQASSRRAKERAAPVSQEALVEAILSAIGANPNGVLTDQLCHAVGRTAQELGDPLEALQADDKIKSFGGLWFSQEGFDEGRRKFVEALKHAHERQPTQAYAPRERIVHVAGLTWSGKPLDRILSTLVATQYINMKGTDVKLVDFRPQLAPRRREFLDRVVVELEKVKIDVPNPHELARALTVPPRAVEEILKVGVESGELIRVADGVFYTPRQLKVIKKRIREITNGRPVAASLLRERLGTTRKYLIPLLEHFDDNNIARQMED